MVIFITLTVNVSKFTIWFLKLAEKSQLTRKKYLRKKFSTHIHKHTYIHT